MKKLNEGKNNFEPITESKGQFTDNLDLWKYTIDVHSKINDQVKADFVLAKLGEKDKEAIIEMTTNAYMAKKLYSTLKERIKKETYNKKLEAWITTSLSEKEREAIETIGKRVFDTIMTRVYMTVIMNRNVERNHLMIILAKIDQEEEKGIEEPQQKKSVITRLIDNVTKRNTENDKRIAGE